MTGIGNHQLRKAPVGFGASELVGAVLKVLVALVVMLVAALKAMIKPWLLYATISPRGYFNFTAILL